MFNLGTFSPSILYNLENILVALLFFGINYESRISRQALRFNKPGCISIVEIPVSHRGAPVPRPLHYNLTSLVDQIEPTTTAKW